MSKTSPPIASLSGLGLPQPLLIFLNQLWIRSGGNVDLIAEVEATQVAEDGGNRTHRCYRDEIDALEGELAQLKRQNRNLENMVLELTDCISQSKNTNRLIEQKLNELTERYDSGA